MRDILCLTAFCPVCGKSLRDTCLKTREMADNWSAFCMSASIMMKLEQLGIKISDEYMEAVVPVEIVETLTLSDFVRAGCEANPSISPSRMAEAIQTAVHLEIPEAPKQLDFNVPMLDAVIGPDRYENYRGVPRNG